MLYYMTDEAQEGGRAFLEKAVSRSGAFEGRFLDRNVEGCMFSPFCRFGILSPRLCAK